MLLPVCQSCPSGAVHIFDLCFQADMPVEVPLVSICILCDVQLQLHLGLSHSILTQPDYILLLFLGYLSPACAFPSCPFIFPAGLDSVMQVFYIPDFLHLGRKIFGPLWKMSSKVYQLCSSPVFLRAVSQGVLLTCLNTWKFSFLKFRILKLLFT